MFRLTKANQYDLFMALSSCHGVEEYPDKEIVIILYHITVILGYESRDL